MPASSPPSRQPDDSLTALDRGVDLLRLGGLSDALFAIVLTLLVLELRLPQASYTSDTELAAGLLTLVPALYAYVLTFAVGSLHWIAHHRVVSLLRGYDRGLLMWNLLFLGTVSGLPFSSGVVGRNGSLFLGWSLYAANVVIIGVVLSRLIDHATRRALFRQELGPSVARMLRSRALAAPAVFAASVPVALASTTAAELMPLLLFVYTAALARRYRTPRRRAGDRSGM